MPKVARYAVIVAGGKGLRMGGDVPKQFQLLAGRPVLMRTLERFHEAAPDARLVVVLPQEQMAYWQTLCAQYAFALPHRLVAGGATRFESVRNGLRCVPDEAVVAVHDGVRPMVSVSVIQACFEAAERGEMVVSALQSIESVRLGTAIDSRAVDRATCWLVQTPQTFPAEPLKRAYAQPYNERFTDDASVVEAAGHHVMILQGNRENVKLTTPFDVKLAEMLLS